MNVVKRNILNRIENKYKKASPDYNKNDLLNMMDSVAKELHENEYYPEASKCWKTY